MSDAETEALLAAMLGGKRPWILPLRLDPPEGEGVRGSCPFSPEDPWFEGHFPGEPIVPGIVLLEALLQAAARSWAPPPEQDAGLMLLGLDRVRFKRAVRPGERLDFELVLRSDRGPMRVVAARGWVGDEEAVAARLRLSLAPAGVRR